MRTRLKNGFTNAPSLWQLGSAILYLLITVHFFVMISFVQEEIKRIVYGSIDACIFGFVFFIWLRVSIIDPADSIH